MKRIEWKNISIKNKLIIAVPLLATIMWLVMTYLNLNRISQDTKHIITNYFKAGANEYIALVGSEMKAGNAARVRRITYNFIDNNIFLNAFIVSNEGEVIFESDKVSTELPDELKKHAYIEPGEELLGYYYYPIMDGNGIKWGAALLEPPNSFAADVYNRRVYQSLSFALGLLLLEIGALIFVLFKMFKPLEELSGNIHDMASKLPNIESELGTLRDFIATIGNSEIASLGKQVLLFIENMFTYKEKSEEQAHLAAIGQSTAMIAHDMRRPLASVKALLNMLPTIKDDPARLEKMAADVDQTITRTNAMLNEIMDFSRDSTALELKECEPKAIFAAAVSEALRNHPEADVEIAYELDSEHVFHCDVARVTRVFANLIDNALGAMAGKGRGRLCIKTGEDIKDKRFIIAQVKDSGGGIPEEYLPKIFDPFFTKGKKGGTGLGLAICQKVANMHGGEISAWNVPDIGAVFSVRLPAGATEAIVEDDDQDDLIHDSKELKVFRAEETRREPLGDTANTAEFMRINKQRGRISTLLVVDDEPLFRETIRSLLNTIPQVRDHVKVIEADSAEMGLRLFGTIKFDYAIADIDLGKNKMNGYKLTQAILALHPDTYVLIHSNRRKAELDERIRGVAKAPSPRPSPSRGEGEGGGDTRFLGFLPKPMKADELLQFLACKSFEESVVASAEGAKQSSEINCMHGIASSATPPRNDKQPTALLLNDDESLIFCFSDDLKKLGYQVLGAKNVSGAMEHFINRKIDMIVSDINLGDCEPTGYDFLNKVREKDTKVPFVFTSGYNRRDEWDKAKGAGATEYLQIPYELHELKKALGV